MFFDKASQQAFVFPAKCGTHTTMQFLHACGWKNIGKNHFVPETFIKQYPNLQNYRIYAWFRDPVKRFESGILHIKQVGYYRPILDQFLLDQGINETRQTVTYEHLIDVFPAVVEKFQVIFDPQSKWYAPSNVEPLDFDNMEAELRRITGNAEQPLVRWNTSTDFGRSVITDKVRAFVREYYAADYALAKNRLGKTYEG